MQLLAQTLEPLGRALTPAAAQAILSVQSDAATRDRLTELAQRCDQDQLTPEERAEYQLYVEVGDLVALLQARARQFLAGRTGS